MDSNSYNFSFNPNSFYSQVPNNVQNLFYNLQNPYTNNEYWMNSLMINTRDSVSSMRRNEILDSSGKPLIPVYNNFNYSEIPNTAKNKHRKGFNKELNVCQKKRKFQTFKEDEMFVNRKHQLLDSHFQSNSMKIKVEDSEESKRQRELFKYYSKFITMGFKYSVYSSVHRKIQIDKYQKKLKEKGFLVKSDENNNICQIKIPESTVHIDLNDCNKTVHIEKKRTVLSNVQRRNVLKVTEDNLEEKSIFLLAMQGETVDLDQKLSKTNYEQINEQNNNGYTALMFACYWNQKRAVELLLYRGARMDIFGYNGENALLFAAQGGYKDILEYLLKCGDEINWCDFNTNSALMFAAYHNHTDCCELLLDWGIDYTIINDDGYSVFDIMYDRPGPRNLIRKYYEDILEQYEELFRDHCKN